MAQDVTSDTTDLILSECKEITTLLRKPIKDKRRIKYTCFNVSTNYIALGSTSGSIYLFSRDTCIFQQLIPLSYGAATHISISPDEKVIAISTTDGNVCLVIFKPTVKEAIISSKHERNGDAITALCWNDNSSELYIGDANGSIHVMGLSIFTVKRGIFQDPACPIMGLEYKIVQMDFCFPFLLISTLSNCYICNTIQGQYEKVGVRTRQGEFGACFYKPKVERDLEVLTTLQRNSPPSTNPSLQESLEDSDDRLYPRIYCARPGSRLWEVKTNGKIIKTHNFKDALAIPPSFSQKKDSKQVYCQKSSENDWPPQSLKFSPLHIVAGEYLFTYNINALYILDHVNSAVILWSNEYRDIAAISVIQNCIYLMTNSGNFHCLELRSTNPKVSNVYSQLNPNKFPIQMDSGIVVVNEKNFIQKQEANNGDSNPPVELKKMIESDVDALNRQNLIGDDLEKNETNESLDETNLNVDYVNINDENIDIETSIIMLDNTNRTKDETSSLINDVQTIYSLANSINNDMPDHEIDLIIKAVEEITASIKNSYAKLLHTKPSVFKFIETAAQYYRNIFLSKIGTNKLSKTQSKLILDQMTSSFVKINQSNQTDCECSFPQPTEKLVEPKYSDIGRTILKKYSIENQKTCINLCRKVPYLWRAYVEIYGQGDEFFDERIFAECLQTRDDIILSFILLPLTAKQWNPVIKWLSHLKLKQCLSCNRPIKSDDRIDSSINWNNVTNEIMRREGPDIAVNFLTTVVKILPSLTLNKSLFQSLIFTKIVNINGIERPIDFNQKVNQSPCDKYSSLCCPKVQNLLLQSLEKDLNKQLTKDVFGTRAHHWGMHYNSVNSICPCCTLPLQTPILLDNNGLSLFPCGHSYHVNCLIQKKILKCHLHT